MTVLGIGMVASVMARRLDQPNSLEERNEASVLRLGSVRPFMNLVCINAQNHEEPNVPGQGAEAPRYENNQSAQAEQVPRTLPPIVASEIPRVLVMQDVRFGNQASGDRPLLAAIGILQPVEKPGDKIREQDHERGLE